MAPLFFRATWQSAGAFGPYRMHRLSAGKRCGLPSQRVCRKPAANMYAAQNPPCFARRPVMHISPLCDFSKCAQGFTTHGLYCIFISRRTFRRKPHAFAPILLKGTVKTHESSVYWRHRNHQRVLRGARPRKRLGRHRPEPGQPARAGRRAFNRVRHFPARPDGAGARRAQL